MHFVYSGESAEGFEQLLNLNPFHRFFSSITVGEDENVKTAIDLFKLNHRFLITQVHSFYLFT